MHSNLVGGWPKSSNSVAGWLRNSLWVSSATVWLRNSLWVNFRLLAQVLPHLRDENLRAGFKSSGIVPLDENQVLKRLAGNPVAGGTKATTGGDGTDVVMVLNQACLSLLQDHMGVGPSTKKAPPARGKKSHSW